MWPVFGLSLETLSQNKMLDRALHSTLFTELCYVEEGGGGLTADWLTPTSLTMRGGWQQDCRAKGGGSDSALPRLDIHTTTRYNSQHFQHNSNIWTSYC